MTSATPDLLDFAHHLADLADQLTLPGFTRQLDVDVKGDGTPVTELDRRVEATLRDEILRVHPDHAVVGEEHGVVGRQDGPTWVIDPIDGTRSFITGNAVFATLIALCDEDGEAVAVVSAPAMGHRWDALRGGGARRDGAPIQVSTIGTLDRAQVTFGDLSSFPEIGRTDLLLDLVGATVRQRAYGDFHGFCLVAEGVMDVCVEAIASRWDFAAPKLVVEAAGGTFTDLTGRSTAAGGSGVATNGRLHAAVLELAASSG